MNRFYEKIKRIEKFVFNIIFVFIIIISIIFIYSFIQMKRTNAKYVNIFGYSIMQVITGSMSDAIKIDDVIIIKLTDEVGVNDIITFEQNNDLVTHRIIQMKNEKIITKGDANNTQDKPISKQNIVGKVVFTFHNIGIWKKVLAYPPIIIMFSITIILIYINFLVKDKRKE